MAPHMDAGALCARFRKLVDRVRNVEEFDFLDVCLLELEHAFDGNHANFSCDEAIETLRKIIGYSRYPISLVQTTVAEVWGINPKSMRMKTRGKQVIADARMTAMFICYRCRLGSTPLLGKRFHRDHSTIKHANRHFELIRAQSKLVATKYPLVLQALLKKCYALAPR